MAEYADFYEECFRRNQDAYAHIRDRLKRKVNQILRNPYHNTERLGGVEKGLNLRGCRSARIDRNFRIIFVICEECRKVEDCQYCFCDGLPDRAIVFLTFGPHKRAYQMK